MQLAEAPVPDRTHMPLKVPVLLVVRVKLMAGVIGVPGEVSVTVTLHDEAVFTVTGLAQVTVVVVDRRLTVTLVGPLLPAWAVSPG